MKKSISWTNTLNIMMKTRSTICGLLSGLLLLAAGTARAGVIYGSPGIATGIQDLNVNGNLYDVSFVFGSYDAVFAVNTPTFLNDLTDANAAADALDQMLNLESAMPLIGNGSQYGVLWVPYQDPTSSYFATQSGYQPPNPLWQRFGNFTGAKDQDLSSENWGFAVFSAAAVPETSSTLLLLGIGILPMLGVARRMRK